MTTFRDFEAGFSMIEIVVSLFLFTLVLLGVVQGYLLVQHQQDLLLRERKTSVVVHELIQRYHRNMSERYFAVGDRYSISAASVASTELQDDQCRAVQACDSEDVKDYDFRWFISEIHNVLNMAAITVVPCVQHQYLCFSIVDNHERVMEFIVDKVRG